MQGLGFPVEAPNNSSQIRFAGRLYSGVWLGFCGNCLRECTCLGIAENRFGGPAASMLDRTFQKPGRRGIPNRSAGGTSLVIELKAAAQLASAYEVQPVNYLKAADLPVGLLLNFGQKPQLKCKILGVPKLDPPSSDLIRV